MTAGKLRTENCKNMGRAGAFECPNCGNHVCADCAENNMGLCPNCFSRLYRTS